MAVDLHNLIAVSNIQEQWSRGAIPTFYSVFLTYNFSSARVTVDATLEDCANGKGEQLRKDVVALINKWGEYKFEQQFKTYKV